VRFERQAAWKWFLAGSLLLALPTAALPGSHLAVVTYMSGSACLTAVLFVTCWRTPRSRRLPWLLLATVTTMWFSGDALQRLMEALDWHTSGIGIPDLIWLSSYLLEIAAVNALIKAKGLPPGVSRDIRLDVIVVATTAGLAVWHILIEPGLSSDSSLTNTVVSILYPLGDVVVFSMALAVILVPGSWGIATLLLVGCLGVTLPLDFVFQYVQAHVTGFNAGRLDAIFLVINSTLGAAALHPDRGRLTERMKERPGEHLQLWRVGALGLSLAAVNVTNAIARGSGSRKIPDLVATMVISFMIIIRFYRASRAQERTATALRNLADYDPLTGAANRALLKRRLPHFLIAGPGLLIFIDLDGFKAVNDNHGHQTGDTLLRAVTERLAAITRDTDTIARIGGDEFVVLLHGSDPAEAPVIADRILIDLCRPVAIGSSTITVGASIGVVVLDPATSQQREGRIFIDGSTDEENADVAEDILKWADSAMYDAKRHGGGIRIVQYDTIAG
jgi:diguanylate cyclase (GGDEF)-like protein